MIIKSSQRTVFLVSVAAVAAGIVMISTFIGFAPSSWHALMARTSGSIDSEIIWQIRFPRICLGLLTGAVLAVGGMAFQAVFRNSLATPYTLGISSGASVGAALYMKSGLRMNFAGISGVSVASFIAALGAIGIVYGLTRIGRAFSATTLLLAGVAVSFFFSSVVLFVQYIGDVATSFRVGRWLMGGLEVVGFVPVWQFLPFATLGLATIVGLTRELDLLTFGGEMASARGVAVTRVKKAVFFATSLMVGGAVAVAGPIGFVGLIVPHVGRTLIGPQHRYLAIFCLIAGGAFLVACDTVARTIIAPVEVPVGIITALLGGPFFLVILLKRRTHEVESES